MFHKFQHFLLVKRFFAQFTPYLLDPFKSSKEGFCCMFVKERILSSKIAIINFTLLSNISVNLCKMLCYFLYLCM